MAKDHLVCKAVAHEQLVVIIGAAQAVQLVLVLRRHDRPEDHWRVGANPARITTGPLSSGRADRRQVFVLRVAVILQPCHLVANSCPLPLPLLGLDSKQAARQVPRLTRWLV